MYKVIGAPVLLYSTEPWVSVKKHLSWIHATGIGGLILAIKDCTRWDRFYIEDVRDNFKTFNIQSLIA